MLYICYYKLDVNVLQNMGQMCIFDTCNSFEIWLLYLISDISSSLTSQHIRFNKCTFYIIEVICTMNELKPNFLHFCSATSTSRSVVYSCIIIMVLSSPFHYVLTPISSCLNHWPQILKSSLHQILILRLNLMTPLLRIRKGLFTLPI